MVYRLENLCETFKNIYFMSKIFFFTRNLYLKVQNGNTLLRKILIERFLFMTCSPSLVRGKFYNV
jgi:hypothetical protein